MSSGLYVCVNCGLLGTLTDFNEDCTPGWTHGKLVHVTKQATWAGYWNPTPEQRERAHSALHDLWKSAEDDGDDELVEVVKVMLSGLGLPWVSLQRGGVA